MGIFSKAKSVATVQLMSDTGTRFSAWNGKAYESDIVRSCIRPLAAQASKLQAKHLRDTVIDGKKVLQTNPEVYMRFLLTEPNAYMGMSKFLEKMAIQYKLNNNAFALIVREQGYPVQLLPINCTQAEAMYDSQNRLYIRFTVGNAYYTFPYTDIIHIRKDFAANEIFGSSNTAVLRPLMETVTTTDQGMVSAIKNSAVIKWLLKFNTSTRPEDQEKEVKRFAEQFLSVTNGTGVAGIDTKADAVQVKPNDYVPNGEQMDKATERLYSLFGVNKAIVQNSATEDELNAYYENDVEPFVIAMQEEFTRKLFTRKERGYGNRIVFDATLLTTASWKTKLNLVALVDRGVLSPNEMRAILNYSPIDGGDEYIRRLDTAPVEVTSEEN